MRMMQNEDGYEQKYMRIEYSHYIIIPFEEEAGLKSYAA